MREYYVANRSHESGSRTWNSILNGLPSASSFASMSMGFKLKVKMDRVAGAAPIKRFTRM